MTRPPERQFALVCSGDEEIGAARERPAAGRNQAQQFPQRRRAGDIDGSKHRERPNRLDLLVHGGNSESITTRWW
jgi:hypothetical protein